MNDQFETLSDNYQNKTESYYHNQRMEMLEFIPSTTKRMLEIGCSTGQFGANVKKMLKDVEIWGIEPNENVVGEARELLDKVINATFEKDMPQLVGQKFDTIVFNDVLEHLIDPGLVLQWCHQYLSSGGVIVASIPNVLFFPSFFHKILIKQDWEYEKEGIFDNTHLRFFTKKSIVRLFTENDYSIQRMQGINSWRSFKFSLLNTLLMKRIDDWQHLQFAVVAKTLK